jgi:hypothetical protein
MISSIIYLIFFSFFQMSIAIFKCIHAMMFLFLEIIIKISYSLIMFLFYFLYF